MKQWLKKITGVQELEHAAEQAALQREQEEQEILKLREQKLQEQEAAAAARRDHELAQMTPKERATANNEPWVNVLDVKINQDNIRNGFFELDWNRQFIDELIKSGYGYEADPEEEIVDRWFRDIVYYMLSDEGLDTERGYGYVNVVPIQDGKSEVS